MLRNHLKMAVRNLFKRKGYALLNIAGLAIGISCCLLIFQYVALQRSYDGFNGNADQVVRLRLDQYRQGKLAWKSATIFPAIGPTLKKDFPEVENFCRLHDAEILLSNDDRNIKFSETKGYYADTSAFNILSVHLTQGNAASALEGPNKIVLSQSMAKKYFGNEDAFGKRLVSRDQDETISYEVTGAFEDYPAYSHLKINYLVSYATLASITTQQGDTTNSTETSFGWYDFYTYIQLKPGTDIEQFNSKLAGFCSRYLDSQEWATRSKAHSELYTIPVTDIHLYSNYNQEAEVNGDGQAVSFLFLIAFFIVAIAWINYINLATARSVERAREVGVRKVLGADRASLIRQFLVESILLNITALMLAFFAVLPLTPKFNELLGETSLISFSLPAASWLTFASIFLAGTMLSGLYPAFILSAYQPISVLKGLFKNTNKGVALRKGLIIGQFATSVILIAGTIIVYQQVSFMRNQKLGANIDETIVLNGAESHPDSLYKNIVEPFRNDLLQVKGVKSFSTSSTVMGKEIYWTRSVFRADAGRENSQTMYMMGVDYNFVPSYELDLIAGRNFSKDFRTDTDAVLINQRAAELLGFENAEKAVNDYVVMNPDTLKVIGVINNYHHQGLQKAIDPMVILLRPDLRQDYSLKVETANMQKTIASVQQTWDKYFPTDPFSFYFLDEAFAEQYKSDALFGKVFGLFSFLAILIACFGLLGLSAYNVLQRTKEIGIRKVLGASIQNLLFLLSKEFLLLVLIGFIIATPVCWWVMNEWLKDYAYRITINWWVFLLSGLIASLIAVATVSLQAFKASIANPVKSLRME